MKKVHKKKASKGYIYIYILGGPKSNQNVFAGKKSVN